MPAPCFAEVLDDAMARARTQARRTAAWSAAAARDAADPFVFSRPLSPGAAWARTYARPAAPAQPPPPPRARIEARRLTAGEQHALTRLVGLGAVLTETFTADDLKREYRRLALRHHPDRRSAESAADASATFAEVAAAYRCLRHVVAPRH